VDPTFVINFDDESGRVQGRDVEWLHPQPANWQSRPKGEARILGRVAEMLVVNSLTNKRTGL
jgi:hypothetical protein